jgi:hypothetical protein
MIPIGSFLNLQLRLTLTRVGRYSNTSMNAGSVNVDVLLRIRQSASLIPNFVKTLTEVSEFIKDMPLV